MPSVEVICVAIHIRRIAVNQIILPGGGYSVGEIPAVKLVFSDAHRVGYRPHLIYNFCNVGWSETIRLAAKGNVELALPVEANQPVEA